jgi:DNA polymerase-1
VFALQSHAFDMSIPGARWVETEHEARQWIDYYLQRHRETQSLGIDSETTGKDDKLRETVVVWSLSDGATRICLDKKFLGLFKEPILENPDINFDFTNVKFDTWRFGNTGVDLVKAGNWHCTLPQSWLYNENNQGRHGLKECISDYFGRVTPTFQQTFGKVPPRRVDKRTGMLLSKTVEQLIKEKFSTPDGIVGGTDYASLDAYNSFMLRRFFDTQLAQIDTGYGWNLAQYYHTVEVPFSKVLYKMERRGVTVDAGYLKEQGVPMQARMTEIEHEFNRLAGKEVNLDSVHDMRLIFFDILKKESIKKTKGGKTGIKQDSTDAEVLETWAGEGDPWAQLALEYRGISKIKGTYVDGLQHWIDGNYRIHTSLNQTGTVTGRLSSSEPNLQNIPRADEDDFKIREAFIPAAYKRFVVADYEQLEMRLMAHFSGDPKMIDAIQKGMDLHCFTTAEIEGIPYEEVLAAKKVKKKEDLTTRQHELLLKRQNNKSTGFGIIYGIGGPKLAAKLTRETKHFVSEEEGWALINRWLNVFPDVKNYIDQTNRDMERFGFVQVITGRFRRFGDVRNMNRRDAAQAKRQAVNAVIQGTAAECAKYAMIACDRDPELKRLEADMLLQIHDELMFECPDSDEVSDQVQARVKEIMEHPFPGVELRVPLPASAGKGYSWASAK